jgi:hypothetical protein
MIAGLEVFVVGQILSEVEFESFFLEIKMIGCMFAEDASSGEFKTRQEVLIEKVVKVVEI